METKLWAIGLVILCTLFTTAGQLLYKEGVSPGQNIVSALSNPLVILGLACYGVSSVLLVIALRHGELSVLYPFIALSFLWVALVSVFFLKEAVSVQHWLGVIVIMSGIGFIGYGAEHG